MTAAEGLSRVKYRFGIPQATTTFDTDINKAVEIAVESLASYVQKPQAANTTYSLAINVDTLAWDFTTSDIDKIFFRASSTDVWQLTSAWYKDNATIYFTEYFGQAVSLKILPYAPYTLADIANIPTRFAPALVDFACAEYAAMLAGSKTKFNIYQQNIGARGVDSLTALSEFYENRGHDKAEKQADPQGLL